MSYCYKLYAELTLQLQSLSNVAEYPGIGTLKVFPCVIEARSVD